MKYPRVTFQSTSAAFTSGRLPRLFSLFSLCRMCQLSSIHCVAVYGLLSRTSALLRSMPWPDMRTCSANAEAATLPFLRARQCSFSRCSRDLPVCPMYTVKAYCAGNRVDHSLSFTHWHSVLGVNQRHYWTEIYLLDISFGHPHITLTPLTS